MTELLGVGGFVPKQICTVAPYLSNLQSHPDPMKFAVNTFTLMQVATYVAGFGAGGCMAFQFHIYIISKLLNNCFIGSLCFLLSWNIEKVLQRYCQNSQR
jgi:hypothetical protein